MYTGSVPEVDPGFLKWGGGEVTSPYHIGRVDLQIGGGVPCVGQVSI